MYLYRAKLENIFGKTWFEVFNADSEKDLVDVVYMRYGLVVSVVAIQH